MTEQPRRDLPYTVAQPTYFALDGIGLNAAVAGPDGPLVVLLHGFPEFWYGWRHQIEPLAAAGFRVVAPDQRGYDLSGKPEGIRAYRLERLAGDVTALIEACGRRDASLVGHDWGGIVAWYAAARHPHRVRRPAVINAPHPAVIRDYLKRRPTQLLRSSYAAFFQLRGVPEWLARQQNFALLRHVLTGTSRRGAFTPEDLARYQEAWSQPGALTAMLNWYRAAKTFRPARGEARIRQPALVLWGMRDRFLEFGLAEASAGLCDNAEIRRFPRATHWLQHEEPDAVNAELVSFLHAA